MYGACTADREHVCLIMEVGGKAFWGGLGVRRFGVWIWSGCAAAGGRGARPPSSSPATDGPPSVRLLTPHRTIPLPPLLSADGGRQPVPAHLRPLQAPHGLPRNSAGGGGSGRGAFWPSGLLAVSWVGAGRGSGLTAWGVLLLIERCSTAAQRLYGSLRAELRTAPPP